MCGAFPPHADREVVAYRERVAVRTPLPPDRRASVRSDRRAAASLAVALVCALVVLATWWLFVTTRTGQAVDHAAMRGAELGQGRLLLVAEPVLSVISVPFLVVVLGAAMLLAFLRRRVLLAVQVAVLVGGANLSTQVLKHDVLGRPDLGVGDRLDNALPSGHTTAAASVSAALLFVVPARFRPAAAVGGVLYTSATGLSTLVGQWHRPSDVVAAVLVVLAWAGLVGSFGVPSPGRMPGGATVPVALLAVGLAAGGVAVAALTSVTRTVADGAPSGRADLLTAYGGGAAGVVAVTALAFGVLLLLRRPTAPVLVGPLAVDGRRRVDATS